MVLMACEVGLPQVPDGYPVDRITRNWRSGTVLTENGGGVQQAVVFRNCPWEPRRRRLLALHQPEGMGFLRSS